MAFNRTVVLRYRISLEQRQFAPSTINLRLAAVRRIAYEAADSGLLSPELAAGIRRVKGVRRLGLRVGNWLTAEQGKKLPNAISGDTLREKRNHAMLSLLIGCGLRRAELLGLTMSSIQFTEDIKLQIFGFSAYEVWEISFPDGTGEYSNYAKSS